MWALDHKKAECPRIDAFELWCWIWLLRVPWTTKRPNQSILKEISPEYSLEGLMLQLKLQYFGYLMQILTHWKRPWCWERLMAGQEGDNRGWEGWMASPTQCTWVWASPGRWWWKGSLMCCSPWGHKESDTTEWLNWTEFSHSRKHHRSTNDYELTGHCVRSKQKRPFHAALAISPVLLLTSFK